MRICELTFSRIFRQWTVCVSFQTTNLAADSKHHQIQYDVLETDGESAPVLASDILRYFSLVGVPSLAPAVAIAKAEAADSALRLLSNSRHEDITIPLL